MRWIRRTCLAAATLAIIAAVQPASAEFEVCNDSKLIAYAAVGYWDNVDYVTEGWWTIDPATCVVVYEGQLEWQWYYVYAESDEDANGNYTTWDGTTMLCTHSPNIFTIIGSTDCATGFFEIDIGKSPSWTHRLN